MKGFKALGWEPTWGHWDAVHHAIAQLTLDVPIIIDSCGTCSRLTCSSRQWGHKTLSAISGSLLVGSCPPLYVLTRKGFPCAKSLYSSNRAAVCRTLAARSRRILHRLHCPSLTNPPRDRSLVQTLYSPQFALSSFFTSLLPEPVNPSLYVAQYDKQFLPLKPLPLPSTSISLGDRPRNLT